MTRYDREPMSPLRRRYIDDLRLRNKSPRTIETYVLRVALYAKHFGRSPEQLGPDEIRAYQQHLLARQLSWSQFNQTVCALRFLDHVTLGRGPLRGGGAGAIGWQRTGRDTLFLIKYSEVLRKAPQRAGEPPAQA